jgi:hypothetical protein
LSDTQLRSNGTNPKVIIDFPFDDTGHGPEDDQERLDRFVENNDPTNTVCWIPSFFSSPGLSALRTYVAISELLKGDRYEQHTSHLSHTQRQEARPILKSQRDQLHDQLVHAIRNAYGVVGGTNPLIDPANTLSDHFRSLDPSHPGLLMNIVRNGARWFVFRRRKVGMNAPKTTDKVNLRALYLLGSRLSAWKSNATPASNRQPI